MKMCLLFTRFFIVAMLAMGAEGRLLDAVEEVGPLGAAPGAGETAAEATAQAVEEQPAAIPAPPPERILDNAGIFSEGEAVQRAEKLRGELSRLFTATGCQVYVATTAEGKGNSAKKAAESFVAQWLPAGVPGAVLAYDRETNSFGVSATDAALAVIPAYLFALMEQTATSARNDGGVDDMVALAAGDLEALFQKHFDRNAKQDHPAARADVILFAAVSGMAALLVAAVAFFSWRRQQRGAVA